MRTRYLCIITIFFSINFCHVFMSDNDPTPTCDWLIDFLEVHYNPPVIALELSVWWAEIWLTYTSIWFPIIYPSWQWAFFQTDPPSPSHPSLAETALLILHHGESSTVDEWLPVHNLSNLLACPPGVSSRLFRSLSSSLSLIETLSLLCLLHVCVCVCVYVCLSPVPLSEPPWLQNTEAQNSTGTGMWNPFEEHSCQSQIPSFIDSLGLLLWHTQKIKQLIWSPSLFSWSFVCLFLPKYLDGSDFH